MSLIESFPVPPTHIPSNPPPSLPPSSPLPPVPGPSPLSDRDTLLFLSSSRSSSASCSSSRPTSIITVSSISSNRSRRHNKRLNDNHRPSIAFSISEESEIDAIERVLDLNVNNDDQNDLNYILRPPPPTQHSNLFSRQRSNSHLPSLPPPSTLPPKDLPPLPPTDDSSRSQTPKRSTSPDISTILSSTPRPSKSRSRSLSRFNHSRNPSDSLHSRALAQSWSQAHPHSRSRSRSKRRGRDRHIRSKSHSDHPQDPDDVDPIDPEMEARLERQLEGDGTDESQSDWGDGPDSDSSLDLKTPLSHLMLRHGHLSPHSKLLPQNDQQNSDARPISTTSLLSTMSKLKDDRDTPKRRCRHRDGTLLRGGIGLTTGLGWSDSEDEDAPSALTRRLSTLNLSRRPSESASLRSVPGRSGPSFRLAKSFSGVSQRERQSRGADEFGVAKATITRTPKTGSILKVKAVNVPPPTSWASSTSNPANRTSTSSIGSSGGGGSSGRGGIVAPSVSRGSSSSTTTASSVSLVTPSGVDLDAVGGIANDTTADKALLALPVPAKSPKRARAFSAASGPEKGVKPLLPFPPSAGLGGASAPSSPVVTTHNGTTPRPLQLPSGSGAKTLRLPSILRSSSNGNPSVSTVKPPALSSSVSGGAYSRHVNDQQRLRASSGPRYSDSVLLAPNATATAKVATTTAKTPPTPTTPKVIPKPKPRTGTGMVYRNTASYTEFGGRVTSGTAVGGGSMRMRTPGGGAATLSSSTSSAAAAAGSFSSNNAMRRTKVALVV